MQEDIAAKTEAQAAAPQEVAWRGIELCRSGSWDEGLYLLSRAVQGEATDGAGDHGASDRGAGDSGFSDGEFGDDRVSDRGLPSQLYALLGYGLARFQNQREQGLRLCRHAVEVGLYQPENYYYLARTWLTFEDRRAAIDALEKGLQIDSTDPALLELKWQLGNRRRPILAFLPRSHVLNRTLGRLRHGLLGDRQHQDTAGSGPATGG